MIMKRHVGWLVCGAVLVGCNEQPKPAAEIRVAKAPALEAATTDSATTDPSAKTSANDAAVDSTSSKADSTPKKTEPYQATVGGFKFTVPGDWEERPLKSSVLLGEFSIPGAGGPARLTLSSAGGGIEANLGRWRGQFNPGPGDAESVQSDIKFVGQTGTLIELSGTFADMFGGGKPNKNWKMLGVAIPLGGTDFFVKMTGPAAAVTARRDEFVKFIESAKK